MFITWSRLGGRFWSIDQKPHRTPPRARGARPASVLVRSALGFRWWLALRTLPRGLCSLACRLPAQFMSTASSTAPPQLPVPTGEVLMEAVGTGPQACRLWAERFLDWPAEQAVPQIVMNALDPLLVEVIVGADHVDPLISMLRRHYATVRERYPGPFADVERVWGIQREWWLQFVVDEEQSGTGRSRGDLQRRDPRGVLSEHAHSVQSGKRRGARIRPTDFPPLSPFRHLQVDRALVDEPRAPRPPALSRLAVSGSAP